MERDSKWRLTLRQRLVAKRNELLASLAFQGADRQSQDRITEEDWGPQSHEEFISTCVNHLDFLTLRQVNAALERTSNGHFGICMDCEEPISQRRLEVIPWAEYCIQCQDRHAMDESELLDRAG